MSQHVIPVSTCSVMSVIRRNPNSEIESGMSDVLVRKLVETLAKLKAQIVEKDAVIVKLPEKVQYIDKQALQVKELMVEKEALEKSVTKTKEKMLLLEKQQKLQECLVSQHRQVAAQGFLFRFPIGGD